MLFDLEGIRGPRPDHGHRDASPGTAVGQGLTQVPGARTNGGGRLLPLREPGQGGLGAPAFEAAHRIQRLDLERDRASQHVAEGRALVLRRVEEHRIDRRSRTTDAVEIKSHHCRGLYRCRALGRSGQGPVI
jgi:hypothetical protein